MSFSRPISEQIERLTSSPNNSNVVQLEDLSDAFTLVLKELFTMAGNATSLWENGGVGKRVAESTDGQVRWQSGGYGDGFISLDGISFSTL